MDSGIYLIISPSGKVYVGSSCQLNKRRARHFYDMRVGRHDNASLQRAWYKYGNKMQFVVVENCAIADLIVREQSWMDAMQALGKVTYNQRTIAGPCGPTDEETKRKLSIALKGFKHSWETRCRMRIATKESWAPERRLAQRDKMREAHLKRHFDSLNWIVGSHPLAEHTN